MMKTTLALFATLAVSSFPVGAHGPMINDPAQREKMEQMMKDPAYREKMEQMMKQRKQMGGGHGHGHAHGERGHHQGAANEQTDWGIAGDPKKVTRTIHIEMSDDMRFSPSVITVKKGETIRFHVANKGRVLHEMVIGTKKELDAHAEMMMKFPNMEHDEAYMAHVDPGKSAEIVWLFNREGAFDFACLIPGHYSAGMVGKIKVTS